MKFSWKEMEEEATKRFKNESYPSNPDWDFGRELTEEDYHERECEREAEKIEEQK